MYTNPHFNNGVILSLFKNDRTRKYFENSIFQQTGRCVIVKLKKRVFLVENVLKLRENKNKIVFDTDRTIWITRYFHAGFFISTV